MSDPYLYEDVAYNAFFSDGNDFSKKEYLQKIVYDAFEL